MCPSVRRSVRPYVCNAFYLQMVFALDMSTDLAIDLLIEGVAAHRQNIQKLAVVDKPLLKAR